MSDSKRHHPFTGITTADSEKGDKKAWNKSQRTRTRATMGLEDDDDVVMPSVHERAGRGWGAKDGKQRFDPQEHPKLMRK